MNSTKRGAPGEGTPSTGNGSLGGGTIPTLDQPPPNKQAKLRGGRRSRPEQQFQKAVLDHLTWRGVPGVFAFHPANGGWRSAIEGAILRGQGVIAGTPDIIIIHSGRCYGLELKTDNGRLTDAQRVTQRRLREAGAHVATVYGLDEALAQLTDWRLLKGASS
jgi:hypothetical protein